MNDCQARWSVTSDQSVDALPIRGVRGRAVATFPPYGGGLTPT